jgi:hypothetical protein
LSEKRQSTPKRNFNRWGQKLKTPPFLFFFTVGSKESKECFFISFFPPFLLFLFLPWRRRQRRPRRWPTPAASHPQIPRYA